ncbi:ParA family protein [Variovorax saccharolyticus]|uniref:ParA family protein n=1 Tax=Variovorax saccharolyticus TaxID=3053516 RepID=UPI00257835D6|nr:MULTISPECIES: ParA family protein [unclassified Variovorax]MDM0022692.1 ParA family protein [Variovorax sp. J22R187]MDM0030364.1 ParA family protein [Variovorax sp. J31P216]
MHVVVLSNQKGGVGKSTLSVLLAQWLAERHRLRVGVIDLDTQANASKSLVRFDSGRAAATFFASRGPASARAEPASITLFPGSKGLADLELARPEFILPAFRSQVTALGGCFDFVVIDTPPALGLRMSAALIAATHVVCPIELEEYSIDGVTDMLKTVFGVRRRYNPGLRLAGLVANRFNPHSVRQKAALRDLVAHYSEFVLPAKISTRSAIPEALAAGVPVWRLARSSARDAAAEVSVVFDLVMQRIEGVEAPVALPERA